MSQTSNSCAIVRVVLAGALLTAGPVVAGVAAPFRDGDIVFQTSRSEQSLAVQRATASRYSHMGMIVFRDGKPYVLEAVATVRYTPVGEWIASGVGHRLVIKRLKHADQLLNPSALRALHAESDRFVGRPYDLKFEWSDDHIYCSELVWKVYDRALGIQLGRLQKLRDFRLSDPAVRAKLRERYGGEVPFEETVISPAEMFDSPLLTEIRH